VTSPRPFCWELEYADEQRQTYDRVILATNATAAGQLLAHQDTVLADLLRIPAASAAVVLLGYSRRQIHHPLDGFGFVVPFCEQRRILSASFSSVKFPGRAPKDRVLLRVFVGGACQQELVELEDSLLVDMVRDELAELLGAQGEPEVLRIVRWKEAMPQYHVGHCERVRSIRQRLESMPGLALAGNAYSGVGIPFCVRSGELAAQTVMDL
jgi:oxygen-dependent protoporphyrinogen oxidase